MAATPYTPPARTEVDPVPLAAAVDTEEQPQPERTYWPTAILLLGFVGAVMMAFGAIGAGAILVHDPLLSSSPFAWVRYGHGRQLATALLYLGLGLLIWAWIRLGRSVRYGRLRVRAILAAIGVWTLPLMLAPPLFSKDIYSYLAVGNLALHGFDPYQFGPSAIPGPLTDNVSWVWQNTPSPYGPLFLLIAKATIAITGQHLIPGVIVIRLLMLPGLAMIVYALPKLANYFGGKPANALWLGGANPLILVHLVGGGHNDLLMIGFMMLGAVLALRHQPALGVAAVTIAVTVKGSAGLLLLYLVWVWAGQLRGSAKVRFLKATGYTVAIFVGLFAVISLLARVGLGWIPALSTSSAIVNWLSLPTAAGQILDSIAGWFTTIPTDIFLNIARDAGTVLLVIVIVRQWWLARYGGPEAMRRGAIALFALAVLTPATLPWYFSWPLLLGAGLAYSGTGLVLVAGLSVWMVLVTYPSGDTALYDPLYIVATAACAIVAALALVRPDPLHFSVHTRDFLGARD